MLTGWPDGEPFRDFFNHQNVWRTSKQTVWSTITSTLKYLWSDITVTGTTNQTVDTTLLLHRIIRKIALIRSSPFQRSIGKYLSQEVLMLLTYCSLLLYKLRDQIQTARRVFQRLNSSRVNVFVNTRMSFWTQLQQWMTKHVVSCSSSVSFIAQMCNEATKGFIRCPRINLVWGTIRLSTTPEMFGCNSRGRIHWVSITGGDCLQVSF